MTFNMNVWKVENNQLKELPKSRLDSEERLEKWIARDASITGLDLLIIGRQVVTLYGGRIDLLGLDSEGNLVILELKRDKTSRDIVAQTLDYASWVKDLTYKQIEAIALDYLNKSLRDAYQAHFQTSIPEEINKTHSMVIVASELDPSSERIVQYLLEEYNVNINCIFFDFFKDGNEEYLGRSWLIDPEHAAEKTTSKKSAPWSGLYFVNVGDGPHRSWEDCKAYGFLSAGQGGKYSKALKKLHIGDKVLAYVKGKGYVGYGEVTSSAVMAKDFLLTDGEKLFEQQLVQQGMKENCDDPEVCEWAAGIRWFETLDKEEALTFPGVFANQNVVCKLRDVKTIDFLKQHFPIE